VDPNQSFLDVHTYGQRISNRMWQRELAAGLFGAFAALALLLAAVGLYGVLAQGVIQRRRDIGVRLALGAGRGQILRMVVGEGLTMAAIGAAVGLTLALAGSRVLSSVLFGVSALDPVTLLGVPAALLALAVVASFIPARRATGIDPIVALRSE
jgi:putative ABC transport system permease protein